MVLRENGSLRREAPSLTFTLRSAGRIMRMSGGAEASGETSGNGDSTKSLEHRVPAVVRFRVVSDWRVFRPPRKNQSPNHPRSCDAEGAL